MTSSRDLSPGLSAPSAPVSSVSLSDVSGSAGASPAPLISAIPRELVSLTYQHEETVREVEAVTELAGIQVARGSPGVAPPPAVLELEEL